jgi:hypothetical protein
MVINRVAPQRHHLSLRLVAAPEVRDPEKGTDNGPVSLRQIWKRNQGHSCRRPGSSDLGLAEGCTYRPTSAVPTR